MNRNSENFDSNEVPNDPAIEGVFAEANETLLASNSLRKAVSDLGEPDAKQSPAADFAKYQKIRRSKFAMRATVAASVVLLGGLIWAGTNLGSENDTEAANQPTKESQTTGQQTSQPNGSTTQPDDVMAWNFTDGNKVTIAEGESYLLSGTATVSALTIEEGASLYFDSENSTTLKSTGNVSVRGVLNMTLSDSSTSHSLEFADVDSTQFVGSTYEIVDSDTGLWVVGSGQLVAKGAEKTGWTRLTDSLDAAETTLEVEDATGWQVGDAIAIAPTSPPTDSGPSIDFHETNISAINANSITLDEGPTNSHPLAGGQYAAEVINLTRNVEIRGQATRSGKAHIFINSNSQQTIDWVSLHQLGPQTKTRHPLYFYNSKPSVETAIQGTVISESANEGVVIEDSLNISLLDTSVYQANGTGYIWRGEVDSSSAMHTIAAATSANGYRFENIDQVFVEDAVAVGNRGKPVSGGFSYISRSGVSTYKSLTAHNNSTAGIRVSQPGDAEQVFEGFVGYNNQQSCISHVNGGGSYSYTGVDCFDNESEFSKEPEGEDPRILSS